MQIQHQLGADIIFAFDELTTLMNTRDYQERSVRRTHAWAERCLAEHARLTAERPDRPYQALFGVVQGAQYEDLRRQASRGLAGAGGRRARLRRLRHRRRAGEGEPGHHHRLVRRGAARGPAAAPAGHLRAGRHLHRHRERRRHLRLRLAVPGRPQRRRLHPRRPVQRQHRVLPAGLRADRRRVRLLHLRALHPGLPAPPVQGQGDAGRRRCARSTTSGSSSRWSTASGPASRPATSTRSGPRSSAATTPRSDRRQRGGSLRRAGAPTCLASQATSGSQAVKVSTTKSRTPSPSAQRGAGQRAGADERPCCRSRSIRGWSLA